MKKFSLVLIACGLNQLLVSQVSQPVLDSLSSHNSRISALNEKVFKKISAYNKSGIVPADNLIDDLYKIDNATIAANSYPGNKIVSIRALNNYFAKKIGYYLTGENNSSLSKNYLFLNVGDNDLVFGHNRYFGDEETERINHVITVGFKADLSDGYSELGTTKGLADNIGLNFKWTWFGRGSVYYDRVYQQAQKSLSKLNRNPFNQKCKISDKRRLLLNDLAYEIRESAEEFENKLDRLSDDGANFCGTLSTVQSEKSEKFYEEQRELYLKKYASSEADFLDEQDAKNLVRVGWFSVTGYAPISPVTYMHIDSLAQLPREKKAYLGELDFNYSYLLEFNKAGRLFLNTGVSVMGDNSINGGALTRYDLSELKALGQNDSVYETKKETDIYLGEYKDYISGAFNFQAVYFPKFKKLPSVFSGNWGVSLKLNQKTDLHNDITNVQFGIPFILQGKDEDSPINFELQLRFNDTRRWTNESKDFSVGISVGLPFSSIIY